MGSRPHNSKEIRIIDSFQKIFGKEIIDKFQIRIFLMIFKNRLGKVDILIEFHSLFSNNLISRDKKMFVE